MTNILSIAGFDLFLDVGIKSDIKTAFLLKKDIINIASCYTMQQNKYFDNIIFPSKSFFENQIKFAFKNQNITAIKIGMLGNIDNIKIISSYLENKKQNINVVFDPIIKSSSGIELMNKDIILYLKNSNFLKNIDLITPNINEAEILSDIKIKNIEDVKVVARKIKKTGVKNILIKGGHLNIDKNIIEHYLLLENNKEKIFRNNRIKLKKEIRGTGCMMSTAISCFLSENCSLEESVKKADVFVGRQLL